MFQYFVGFVATQSAPYFYPSEVTKTSYLVTAEVQSRASSGGVPAIIPETMCVSYGHMQDGLAILWDSPRSQLYAVNYTTIGGHVSGSDLTDSSNNYAPSPSIKDSLKTPINNFLVGAFGSLGSVGGAVIGGGVGAVLGGGAGSVIGGEIADLANGLLDKVFTAVPNPPPEGSQDNLWSKTLSGYGLSPVNKFTWEVSVDPVQQQDSKSGTPRHDSPKTLDRLGFFDELKERSKNLVKEMFRGMSGGLPFPSALDSYLDDLWDIFIPQSGVVDKMRDKDKTPEQQNTSDIIRVDLDKYLLSDSKNIIEVIKEKPFVANTYVDTSGGLSMLSHTDEIL